MKNTDKPIVETNVIKVYTSDVKKLSTYKVHPRESYADVIKKILLGEVKI